jgi:hypothetical protein
MDAHGILLVVHTAAGVLALIVGAVVLWSSRRRPLLDWRSAAYHWLVLVVVATAIAMLALDWPDLWWLTIVAVFAYVLALLGYLAPRRPWRHWAAAYVHGQGGAYIALVTALLVVSLTVDGPVHGPAAVVVWVLPSLIGTRLIMRWQHWLQESGQASRTGRRPQGARMLRLGVFRR